MSNIIEEAFKNLIATKTGKTYVSIDPEYIEVNAQDLADLINENKRLSKKVAKFKRKYKEACLGLADRDNDIHDLTTKIIEQNLFIARLSGAVKSESKNPFPSKSSIEFRGVEGAKGYVYIKMQSGIEYATGRSEKGRHTDWSEDKSKAKIYKNLSEFYKEYDFDVRNDVYFFEPIEQVSREPSTPEEFAQKLKSATKEVINAKKGK